MAKVLVAIVRFYQRFISPWLPAQCRFTPTCSLYAVDALRKYGAVRGSGYALWRILRCQPYCDGGHDPVP